MKSKTTRIVIFIFILLLAGMFYIFYDLPSIDSLAGNLNQPSVKITDREGRALYEIIPTNGGRNAALGVENIPQCMKDAAIAVEDKNFYQNSGVDFAGILRAAWINLQGGETLAGGSTITQQTARTLLLGDEKSERTVRRKLRESVLAWQLTRAYSKDEILALYLNQIYYGGMAYGIEAASQTYFGKPAADLLLPECALLAGLPQTPGVYNPFTNPDLALKRQHVVLGLMEQNGFITSTQRIEAENAPLSYNAAPYPIEAPHFVWMIQDQLDELYTAGKLDKSQSLVIRTTLDLNMQHLTEDIIRRRIAGFKPQPGEINRNVNNAAAVILNPRTGEILTLVGSADYFDSSIYGALNMATARRQSGSAFKPIIYAAAFDPLREKPLSAATSILDAYATFTTKDSQPYKPINYDTREHGYVSAREALASSLNIPAVLTLQNIGIEKTIALANQFGIQSLGAPKDYDLSLALGGGEMSLLELSRTFAAFANEGAYNASASILDVRDADGNILYTPEKISARQVIDPRVAWLISDILNDDRARQIGFGLNSILKIDRPAAVKTGTTSNFHDNWTIGYTPNLLVGVWVGNSNYQAMHNVSGLTGAAPIWHETMRAILQGQPAQNFPRPDGLKEMEICQQPDSSCKTEWFIDGTREQAQTVIKNADQKDSANQQVSEFVLVSPVDNTTYRITPNLDEAAQQIQISALADSGINQVTFFVDGIAAATLSGQPYQTWWKLSEGRHRFWAQAITANGETIKSNEATITVVR